MSEIKKRLECILMPEYFVKDRRGGKRVVDAVAPELERLAEKLRQHGELIIANIDNIEELYNRFEELVVVTKAQSKRIADLESRLGDNF